MPIPSKPQTIGLESCNDLLRKLQWEVNTLNKCVTDPEGVVFGTFNRIVTAWQLTEWIWHDMSCEQKSEWKTLSDFQTCCRGECRALHFCRQIATASKHSIVTNFADESVQTELSWQEGSWRAYVIDVKEKCLVVHMLEQAEFFWSNFITSRKIGHRAVIAS